MDVFAALPPELRLHTLWFVADHDLDRLFELDHLQKQPPKKEQDSPSSENSLFSRKSFSVLQHQALLAKYHRKHVVVSNEPSQATISLDFVDYLVANGVFISPSEITLAVWDFSNYTVSLPFLHHFLNFYVPHLHRFCPSISIRLILLENSAPENHVLKSLFSSLPSASLHISSFTIKYQPSRVKIHRPPSTFEPVPSADIACDSLSLHLFRPTQLMRHLCDESRCFHSGHLRKLDLSFNSLTEYDLMGVAFPEGLEYLNLSNNNLRVLCDQSMPLSQLPRLQNLNLCNNNLMRFEFSGQTPSSVKFLNLSGNLFTCYATIFNTPNFHQVQEIDLSRNLLDHFSKFPDSLRKINICNNYFRLDPDELVGIFPSGLVHLAISNPVPLDGFWDEFGNALVEKAGLWDLRFLDVCGTQCV